MIPARFGSEPTADVGVTHSDLEMQVLEERVFSVLRLPRATSVSMRKRMSLVDRAAMLGAPEMALTAEAFPWPTSPVLELLPRRSTRPFTNKPLVEMVARSSDAAATSGNGGSASSSLSMMESLGTELALHAIANGGSGGSAMGGVVGTGGDAMAHSSATNTAAIAGAGASSAATAAGGDGGSQTTGTAGSGGNAMASAFSTNVGNASANGSSYGGTGGYGDGSGDGGLGGDAVRRRRQHRER